MSEPLSLKIDESVDILRTSSTPTNDGESGHFVLDLDYNYVEGETFAFSKIECNLYHLHTPKNPGVKGSIDDLKRVFAEVQAGAEKFGKRVKKAVDALETPE